MIDTLFIEQCKNINVPTVIVKAIIKEESSNKAFVINVNQDGKSLISFSSKNKAEAKEIAQKYITQGFNIDVGFMQLNSANFEQLNTTLDKALEPCTNIYLASTIFYNFYKQTNKENSKLHRIKQSLSAYNTGSFEKGFKNGYVDKYEKYLREKYYKPVLIKNLY